MSVVGQQLAAMLFMIGMKPLLNASRMRGRPCSRLRNTQKARPGHSISKLLHNQIVSRMEIGVP
ncbi:hypothetical protein ABIF64_000592 [Bradyrhizobium japonicum]|uniref:Transposase n=1 Tax=Bradyrhizobium japonicum TaxID=375 RepID=A0ABV2RK00_BRAJP